MNDERWMAYVDGELDAGERAAFEAALAGDPQLAQRVREQRALRRRVADAFTPDLDEPVPERLLAAARGQAVAAEVVDLARTREQRERRDVGRRPLRAVRDWRWPEWLFPTALRSSPSFISTSRKISASRRRWRSGSMAATRSRCHGPWRGALRPAARA